MRVTTYVLPTDQRPDRKDLAPFFERPSAVRIDGSEDLALFRISCVYRLGGDAERTEIFLPTYMFARLEDGRIELVAFRLTRPRETHAYDEALGAFSAIRAHAESLDEDDARKRRFAAGAAFLQDRWIDEEPILRPLLTPPF